MLYLFGCVSGSRDVSLTSCSLLCWIAAAPAANQEDAVLHHHLDLDHHGHALLHLDLGLGRFIHFPSRLLSVLLFWVVHTCVEYNS